ncbi:substrate-binding domain-containing protein [Pseudoxanthomonas sp. z9]|uniref:substrate-binding domain-containing protein n=1 Tax=Pseudoxanthomonas sp. z9 TaxID=2584942 RepID=UPI001143FF32|nr:substrate-binding domain-containing protein [Pseudoxanthomonas sp. z9]
MLHRLPRVALAMCLLLPACLPASAQDDGSAERLRIHGSNTLGDALVPAMVESWLHHIGYTGIRRKAVSAQQTEIRATRDGMPLIVEIGKRGSAAGFSDLVEGNAEIAMLARAPDAAEREAAWQLGDLESPEQEFVVAVDGLAVVVNERNPVRRLSVAQLRELVTGRIGDWSGLGGRNAPIRLHLARAPSGNRDFLRERVLGTAPAAAGAQTHASLAQAARAVAVDPDAVAVVGVASAIPRGTRTLAIADGGLAILPTRINVMSEDYPLVRRYRLYGGPLMSALGRSFAQYSVGRDAQQAVERAGFLAMTLRPARQPGAPDPAQPYGQAVAGTERLPLSLRFNAGSLTTFFDSRGANDLDRLIAYMRLPQNQGRQVTVVGFSHDDGSNRLIATVRSNQHADTVADYLVKQGVPVQRSIGMGATRALGGGPDAATRYRNERVEVWVR